MLQRNIILDQGWYCLVTAHDTRKRDHLVRGSVLLTKSWSSRCLSSMTSASAINLLHCCCKNVEMESRNMRQLLSDKFFNAGDRALRGGCKTYLFSLESFSIFS